MKIGDKVAQAVKAERARIAAWLRQGDDDGLGNAYTIGRDLAADLDAGFDLETDNKIARAVEAEAERAACLAIVAEEELCLMQAEAVLSVIDTHDETYR